MQSSLPRIAHKAPRLTPNDAKDPMFQIQRTASRWTQPLSAGLSKRTPAGEVALSCHPNPLLVERGWGQGRGSLLMCVCVCEHYWWRETLPFALFPKIRGRRLPNPKKESKPSCLPLVWELVVSSAWVPRLLGCVGGLPRDSSTDASQPLWAWQGHPLF